jgi:hypothetical protein
MIIVLVLLKPIRFGVEHMTHKIRNFLIKKGVDKRIAIYVESRLTGLDERKWKFKYKGGFTDIFKPIGGQEKTDVFRG